MNSITLNDDRTSTDRPAGFPLDSVTADESHPHFALVARAIAMLTATARPWSLAALSTALGVSEFHLQRTFTEWAGVSPKRFLQFLSKERALAALRNADDVLSASLAADMSSPGRMHDLLVQCEAVTPGQVRARGRDLVIRHGLASTWFGSAFVAITERGICQLRFVDATDTQLALNELQRAWPAARLVADPDAARDALTALRRPGAAPVKPITLWLRGTNFQLKVWEALLRVPEGRLVSYTELARAAGAPQAVRAVASAVASNAIAVLVPCHRVIRASGVIGDYRWGIERKAALIGWEAARNDVERAAA